MAERRPSRILPLAAVLAVAIFLGLVARFWHPVYGFTALFQLDASNDELKLDAFRDLPVYVYRDTGGYDGLYYAQLALDPTLTDPQLPRALDNASYRARRILPSAVAWILGAGRPSGVIAAYSILNVLAWGALALLLWRALGVADLGDAAAWAAVLFSAGALCSVRLALTDLPAATLLCATVVAAERQRKRTALACLASAALSRETSLLGVAALVKAPWLSVKNALRILLALLPLLGWIGYVRWRFGAAEAGIGNLSWPLVGLVEKWRAALAATHAPTEPLLVWTSLLALAGLTVQAGFILARPQLGDRWWRLGAAYVVLLLCLGTAVWEGFPGAALRVLLPLTIAFNVLVRRTRAGWRWLLLGNLGVGAGLLALGHVPTDAREFAARRQGDVACIARLGDGWYGPEENRKHRWSWAPDHGVLSLETWPRETTTVRLDFGVSSLANGTLVVRHDGHELLRVPVTKQWHRYVIAVPVRAGHADVWFTSDAPLVREGSQPDARALGFSLCDLRLELPKS